MTQRQAPNLAEPIAPIGSSNLTMGSPAIYKIRVRGDLAQSWSEKLGGLQIKSITETGITDITGSLSDQAALSGVLNTLYDLQLPVVSVEHLPHSH
jgi:hypothetical protein